MTTPDSPYGDDRARAALGPEDYERFTGSSRRDVVLEEVAVEEFEKHRPVLSMRDGSIAGCQCMDRVFYRENESWGAHLLAVADALLTPESTVTEEER